MKKSIAMTMNKFGLSLIEVIVSITILAVVFVGLVSIYPFGISITGTAEKETVASFLAQRKVDELRAEGYGDFGTGIIEKEHRLSTQESDYRYDYKRKTEAEYVTGDLTETDTDTGLKKITTTVYYINDVTKSQENFHLTTLISR